MIIREYVESARPVSSQYLGERYDFGICPASIRIEMQKLTDDGFLTQPHTSAGRIPTDKGYRLFVDQLAEGDGLTKISLDFGAGLEQNDNFDDFFGAMRDLAQSAAAVSERWCWAI
jgi:heat-inducible transcription repressor HrcA